MIFVNKFQLLEPIKIAGIFAVIILILNKFLTYEY